MIGIASRPGIVEGNGKDKDQDRESVQGVSGDVLKSFRGKGGNRNGGDKIDNRKDA